MKKLFTLFLCSLWIVLLFTKPWIVFADETTPQYVYDEEQLLTEEEMIKLENLCKTKGEEAKVSILLLTKPLSSYEAEKTYMEEVFDTLYDAGTILADTAMLLINMEIRDVYIQGYGQCEFYLNNDRIEYILDDIIPYLSDGDYYDAMELFIEEVVYYMGESQGVDFDYEYGEDYGESWDGPSNYYPDSEAMSPSMKLKQIPWIILILISFAIGGIAVAIMASSSGGKMTVNSHSYFDEANSRLTVKRDDYVRTNVTKRRKPQETTRSGGSGRSSGGGGISTGGHSHSGGHRGF